MYSPEGVSEAGKNIPEGKVKDLPQNVQDSLEGYEKNGWKDKTNKSLGTNTDSEYENRDLDLCYNGIGSRSRITMNSSTSSYFICNSRS